MAAHASSESASPEPRLGGSTDLLELSRNCLGDRVTFMTQRDYLLPHAENTPQDAFLTDEYGAGEHFHVLIQERQRLQPEGTQ